MRRSFPDWLAARIAAGDTEALIDYRSLEPDGARAHPTEEHFMPLLVAWGAAQVSARAERFHRGIEGGALAMDAYAFWPDDSVSEQRGDPARAARSPPAAAR